MMICAINSKKLLRCLFSSSGKVLLELHFTKGLFPCHHSVCFPLSLTFPTVFLPLSLSNLPSTTGFLFLSSNKECKSTGCVSTAACVPLYTSDWTILTHFLTGTHPPPKESVSRGYFGPVGRQAKQGMVCLWWYWNFSFKKKEYLQSQTKQYSLLSEIKKHISHLAKQAGSPLNTASKPKEQSSHFAMFLLVFHF